MPNNISQSFDSLIPYGYRCSKGKTVVILFNITFIAPIQKIEICCIGGFQSFVRVFRSIRRNDSKIKISSESINHCLNHQSQPSLYPCMQ